MKTKKKRVLKRWVKESIFYLVCIIALIGCFKLLQLQDQHEYKRAIKRCESESNIQVNYTKQGDKYYTCINDLEK